jgi:hypothetical protein
MKIAPIIPVEVTQFIENHNQELIDILTQVIAENKQLRELLNQTGSTPLALPAASTDAIAKNAPTVNAEAVRIAELENKVTLLEKKLEGFKVGSDLYNLKQLEN